MELHHILNVVNLKVTRASSSPDAVLMKQMQLFNFFPSHNINIFVLPSSRLRNPEATTLQHSKSDLVAHFNQTI